MTRPVTEVQDIDKIIAIAEDLFVNNRSETSSLDDKTQSSSKAKFQSIDNESSIHKKIRILLKVVTECVLRLKSSDSHDVKQLLNRVINFIESDLEICSNESGQKLDISLSRKTTLSKESLTDLNKNSLLFGLFTAVPTSDIIRIINTIINNSGDLSARADLVLGMIDQRTIASNPDMSETFNLLVRKGIPLPSEEQMTKLLIEERPRSGQNASKLAKSFLYEQGNSAFTGYIVNYQNGSRFSSQMTSLAQSGYNTPLRMTSITPRQGAHKSEQQNLANFLTIKTTEAENFIKNIKCLIEINRDDLLEKSLNKNADYINQISDHASILSLAAAKKLTHTFEVLINAGFDPLKYLPESSNSFAIACRDQGKIPLELYLKAIREKFGDEKVREVLNEEDAKGRTALTHAIEGRGYLDAINLLLESGADIEKNKISNLKKAAENGHAGVFALLLEKSQLTKEEISEIADFVMQKADYVIDSIILEYVKNKESEIAEKLKTQIAEKIQNLKEEDLFRICKVSGGKTLKYFMQNINKVIPSYELKDHVNDHDENNKTPLYYAINDKAYDSIVKILLSNEANPNDIGSLEDGTKINAVELTIKNKEFSTLEILLKSGKVSENILFESEKEIIKPENNNKLLTKAFIFGLEEIEKLQNISSTSKQILLERSLEAQKSDKEDGEKHLFKECILKIKAADIDHELNIKKLLSEAIKSSDEKMLEILFSSFSKEELLQVSLSEQIGSQLAQASKSIDAETETTTSYDKTPNTPRTPNNSEKLSEQDSEKDYLSEYLALALETANKARLNDSTNFSDKKKIVELLVKEFCPSTPSIVEFFIESVAKAALSPDNSSELDNLLNNFKEELLAYEENIKKSSALQRENNLISPATTMSGLKSANTLSSVAVYGKSSLADLIDYRFGAFDLSDEDERKNTVLKKLEETGIPARKTQALCRIM